MAELADLHMTDVGRIERAERDPGVRTVAKLAGGLGIEPAELFGSAAEARGVPAQS